MRREENQVFDGEFFQTNSNDFAFVLRRKKICTTESIEIHFQMIPVILVNVN